MWVSDPCVDQFIMNMEDTQKKSNYANHPITDNMLAAFAAFMLLEAISFPRDHPGCDVKQVVEQLWSEWKRFFNPLQLALELQTAASSDHPEIFHRGRGAAIPRHTP